MLQELFDSCVSYIVANTRYIFQRKGVRTVETAKVTSKVQVECLFKDKCTLYGRLGLYSQVLSTTVRYSCARVCAAAFKRCLLTNEWYRCGGRRKFFADDYVIDGHRQ